jgi:hypothetical protein
MSLIEKAEKDASQAVPPGIVRLSIPGASGEDKVDLATAFDAYLKLVLDDTIVQGGLKSRFRASDALSMQVSYDRDEVIFKVTAKMNIFIESVRPMRSLQELMQDQNAKVSLKRSLGLSSLKVLVPQVYKRVLEVQKIQVAKTYAAQAMTQALSSVAGRLQAYFENTGRKSEILSFNGATSEPTPTPAKLEQPSANPMRP